MGLEDVDSRTLRNLGVPERDVKRMDLKRFVMQGLGNQVGLHVYDGVPTFDFNTAAFLGDMLASFNGGGRVFWTRDPGELALISFLVTSLNSPVYASFPVQDKQVVDDFLAGLDGALARLARQRPSGGWWPEENDFYRFGPQKAFRAYSLRFGPVKLRFFWARIGNGLYLASKPFILDDLHALEVERAKGNKVKPALPDPAGHAVVKVRAANWNRVLPDYRLSWAENNRRACLNNLGPLASVGRAVVASSQAGAKRTLPELSLLTRQTADQLYGVHFFCPEGGRYELTPDGRTCRCSVHGWAADPVQAPAPATASPLGKLLDRFTGASATLTFLEDGLHAVVTVDRK
jgi:hypothetical protein